MENDRADQAGLEHGHRGFRTAGTRDEPDHPSVLHLVGEFGDGQLTRDCHRTHSRE